MKLPRPPLLAFLLVAASSSSAPPARARAAKPSAPEYSLPEGRFALRPPKGWTAGRDAREDARRKVYGVLLSGPRSKDGVLTMIDVAYYSPGNSLFKDADEFLKRNLARDDRFVEPAGEKTGPIEKTTVGGRPARRYSRRSLEYLPPDRMNSKAVAVTEEVDVVPAESGFYVVTFRASDQLFAEQKKRFSRALAALRFTDEKR